MDPINNMEKALIKALSTAPEIASNSDLAASVIRKIEASEALEAQRASRILWLVNALFLMIGTLSLVVFVDSGIVESFFRYLPWIAVAVLTIGGWSLVEKNLRHSRSNPLYH